MNKVAELAAVLERAGIGPDFDPAQLSAALERARVVGVLDAWAGKDHGHQHVTRHQNEQSDSPTGWCCELTYLDDQCVCYYGATPDAARAAAAKAIEAGEV